jgi:putative ABC transport system permease protein
MLGASLSGVWRDARLGIRTLRRAPAFTLAAVLTLGFCIGINVTVFSVMRSLLWRPLPYPEADRMVVLTFGVGTVKDAGANGGEVEALRARSQSLDHVSTFLGMDADVNADRGPEHATAAAVSDDLLALLGAAPALGRMLDSRQDDVAGAARGVMIGDAFWRHQFGSDPATVGRVVAINNLPMRIVGILRPGLSVFLPTAANAAEQTDVWFPAAIERDWTQRGLPVMARLRPGVTLAQAQSELDGLAVSFMREHPEAYRRGALRLSPSPLQETLSRDVRPILKALGIAVAFVLLIGLVNVANLTLARAKTREQELAARSALGASRLQLARLLFLESLLVGATAGGLGLLAGYVGLLGIEWLKPDGVPLQSQIAMDGEVAAFGVGLGLLCSVAFGLLPAACFAGQRDPNRLKAGRSGRLTQNGRRVQRMLVIAEVGLSMVPLMAAGLMLRTFANLVHAPLGFDADGLVTAKLPMSLRDYPETASRWRVHRDVLERLRQLPGVTGASAVSPLPFQPMQITRRYSRAEQVENAMALTTQQTVTPGYLTVAGIALRAGRDFTLEDIEAQRQVVIVDERLARGLWPEGALGRRLALWSGRRKTELEVIGITNAVRVTQVRNEEAPHIFVPYHVFPHEMYVVMKTTLPATTLAAAVNRSALEAGTQRAVFDVRPMNDYVAQSIGDSRFLMLILTGFSAASLLLAAIGMYGTLAYLVAQRRQELGVRIALGATSWQVIDLVASEGMRLTAAGVAVGMAGSWAMMRLLRGFLYNVQPFDGLTLVGVAAIVALSAAIAAGGPALRASRLDPNSALRSE